MEKNSAVRFADAPIRTRRDSRWLINYPLIIRGRDVKISARRVKRANARAKKENGKGDEREWQVEVRCNQKEGFRKRKREESGKKRRNEEKCRESDANEVVQSSYQRLATKRSISSNRRERNYPYNSYYWVPRHVKIENERRADEIDIRGTSAVVERVFSLFDY